MNHADPKKFITGFLTLAIVASSLTLIFANMSGSDTNGQLPSSKAAKGDGGAKTAFVETIPVASINSIYDGKNLTDELTQSVYAQLFKEDPIAIAENGNMLDISTKLENIDGILATTLTEYRKKSVALPDWDALVEKQKVRVLEDYAQADLAKYTAELDAILAKNIANGNVEKMLAGKDSLPLESIALLRTPTRDTLLQLETLNVPKPLEKLHKNIVRTLVYQNELLALTTESNSDPLLASLIIEKQSLKYDAALQELESEIRNTQTLALENLPKNRSFVRAFLGIQKAHAQFVVTDPPHTKLTYAQILRTLWEWAKKSLLESLKDRLIHRLVQQTITWIQGGGKPQFLTDIKGFLRNAGNEIAGDAIFDIAPNLCRSFGPLIRVQLESTYLSNPPPVNCTLDQVVRNVKDFYNDFSQGGWIAFAEASLPSGNYYGQLFEATQVIEAKRIAAEEAAKADAQASQGFRSQKICTERRNTLYEQCLRDNANALETGVIKDCSPYRNIPAEQQECVREIVTNPGAVLGNAVYNAFGAPIQRIVNANDLNALFSALINSMLNKLFQVGQRGLLGLPSSDSNDLCAGLTGSELEQCMINQACSGLDGQELSDCLNDWEDPECTITGETGGQLVGGSAQCSNQSCGNERTGTSLAWSLRYGHIDYDAASGKLYNVGGEGNPLDHTTWQWFTAPPLSDEDAWCDPNAGNHSRRTSAPQRRPTTYPGTMRCLDGTDGNAQYTGGGGDVVCTPGGDGGGGTDGEICNGGSAGPCNCRGRDNLSDNDFCFLGNVLSAQDQVVEDCKAGTDVGLTSCDGDVRVTDRNKFQTAIAGKLQPAGLSTIGIGGDEIGVSGTCNKTTSGLAGPISSPRIENYAVSSSDGRIRKVNFARAVCPAP